MISLLYECALWIFALATFPSVFFQMLTKGKYRASFSQKLGLSFPSIHKKNRPLIWIHAVSVGETNAVAALAKKLKNSPQNPLVLVSSGTETGHAEAKKSLAFADFHVFLPFDFSWIIKPIIRRVQPTQVILCETDWWYNFLQGCKGCGAQVIVVNGKISERSTRRFLKFSYFSRRLFDSIDLFCVQSRHYLQRFEKLGIDKKKLVITGNIKFDNDHQICSEDFLKDLRTRLSLIASDKVVVIGSTHDPEEKLLLSALKNAWKEIPDLKVIIVPRHPERFDKVAFEILEMGFSLHRYSSQASPQNSPQVILVDTMGLLRKCYQLATIAIVAGSFTPKVGGHNILEPLYYGVPTLFGPHMHSQPEMLELILDYQAGLQVENDAIGPIILNLMADQEQRSSLTNAGMQLIAENRGATNRTHNAIEALLEKKIN